MLSQRFQWLALLGIVLLTFTAYSSAILHGGFIWDDDQYVTKNPLLTDPHGLWEIWTTTKSPQFYPMVFTTFLVERRLWGLNPMGYHAVNVALHAINAILVWGLLRRLKVPGAWMIGAIFAVHPVHVESVAWIAERKNVLSGLFYLLALGCYLQFQAGRRWGWYAGAFGLFLLSLLSKTVAATLPIVLLLIYYLRGWRIGWRTVLELIPFLVMGTVMGLLTKAYEHLVVGARGTDWTLSMGERLLVAGRALAFYVFKLLWPTHLIFSYPRWHLDIRDPTQWGWVLGVILVGLLVWWKRRGWGRGPVVGVAFFGVTLAPALGFVNFYPMRFSFVADHFQYLASIGIMALFIGSITWGVNRWITSDPHGTGRLLAWLKPIVGAGVLAILGVLTWQQGQIYRDPETLWQDTLTENPRSWLAHNNLGAAYENMGRLNEAAQEYRTAFKLKPDYALAHTNLGRIYKNLGRLEEAVQEYKIGIALKPEIPDEAHNNLGIIYNDLGRRDEAIQEYKIALILNPDYDLAHYNLGNAYRALGRLDEAIQEYQSALRSAPDFANAHDNLGLVFEDLGRRDDAVREYQAAIAANPNLADAHNNLGIAYKNLGRLDEALQEYRKASTLSPTDARLYVNMAQVYMAKRNLSETVTMLEHALHLEPNNPQIHGNLGVVYMMQGRQDDAIREYKTVLTINPTNAIIQFNLGVVYYAQGRLSEALLAFQSAVKLDPKLAEAHYHLGQVYQRLGRVQDAITEYKIAMKIKPDYKLAREAVKSLHQ
jgi:tetratricopeptide (TPR) repeat protein